MRFALGLPWWAIALLFGAGGVSAWWMYAGAITSIGRSRRAALIALRALTLILLIVCLLRPVRVVPEAVKDAVVPVLVDVSRSMRLADADGRPRIDAARELLQARVVPALHGRFQADVWTFGETLSQAAHGVPAADAGRSDLSGALRGVRERYRDKRVAGIVVLSDGGDTGANEASAAVDDGSPPVYTIGVGAARVVPDAEVLDITAGEAALADSSVDLTVSAINRGSDGAFDLRVLENGRPIDVRRVSPAVADGPVTTVFTVSPQRDSATVYTVEIPAASGELVLENNKRSVLVEPPRRKRRLLMIEGAPGFEHSFIKRALTIDDGLEVDSIVRKGRDAQGNATYFVQASSLQAPRLANGFPTSREALYRYDGLLLANLEGDALSGTELRMAADFVSERGGGLLVLGARSFSQQGFMGTPLESVLPLGLADRGNGVVRVSAERDNMFSVHLTDAGVSHPVMRIGPTPEDSAARWNSVPPLAGATALGAPRPGAQVLAVVRTGDGPRPLVAVQRYGQGRALMFTGEASWRWRMQLPSDNRTFELFWRQAARWLATAAPDQVTIAPMAGLAPGEVAAIAVDVRDEAFEWVRDAEVTLRASLPGGETRVLNASLTDGGSGRYSAQLRADRPGIYRVTADARQGNTVVGTADRWFLVGAADQEMADPRLNVDVLRRVSQASGGRYFAAADEVDGLASVLAANQREPMVARVEDLWHNIWIFTVVMLLLAMEWMLRRRWGLR